MKKDLTFEVSSIAVAALLLWLMQVETTYLIAILLVGAIVLRGLREIRIK